MDGPRPDACRAAARPFLRRGRWHPQQTDRDRQRDPRGVRPQRTMCLPDQLAVIAAQRHYGSALPTTARSTQHHKCSPADQYSSSLRRGAASQSIWSASRRRPPPNSRAGTQPEPMPRPGEQLLRQRATAGRQDARVRDAAERQHGCGVRQPCDAHLRDERALATVRSAPLLAGYPHSPSAGNGRHRGRGKRGGVIAGARRSAALNLGRGVGALAAVRRCSFWRCGFGSLRRRRRWPRRGQR
jgi:hypothetical protein